ncbi:ABC transporter permease [Streptomyces sp. NPDC004111]|uniref:ABC transporter permease n=1 Tax=Streptomyces sp. NPDC004111 TaxID=3364690 RepID=UPI0036B0D5F4
MSGTLTRAAHAATGNAAPTTTAAGRMKALARTELALLTRNKAGLVMALVLPLALTFTTWTTAKGMDLGKAGLSLGSMVIPTAVAYVLIFTVYTTLVGTYVTRREELVLKRLRTGEPGDIEILTGTSIAALATGLIQGLVLLVLGAVVLDAEMPSNPLFVAVGILLGVALATLLAMATSAFTRSTESSQLTIAPIMLISMFGSGLAFPLESLPDKVASICHLLPFSPVVELMRGGWSGNLTWSGGMGAMAVAAAWIVLSVYAVQKRFRWEPRR